MTQELVIVYFGSDVDEYILGWLRSPSAGDLAAHPKKLSSNKQQMNKNTVRPQQTEKKTYAMYFLNLLTACLYKSDMRTIN